MSVLVRVDDRLVHGRVVVGWGRALKLRSIILVDDAIAASPWEQDLYRMGIPPEMTIEFASLDAAPARFAGDDHPLHAAARRQHVDHTATALRRVRGPEAPVAR